VEGRSYSVCNRCGTWRENAREAGVPEFVAFFNDYDLKFFVEEHLKCPFPPITDDAPLGIRIVRDTDADFAPMPPEKRWRPGESPGYRPPVTPAEVPHPGSLRDRLVGIWATNDFGAHGFEALVFLPDGRGLIEYWNVEFCGSSDFHWDVDRDGRTVHFEGSPPGETGVIRYFGSCAIRTSIVSATDRYGRSRDLLRTHGEPLAREFVRSPRSADGYTRPVRRK
jgi:hypothetical protein